MSDLISRQAAIDALEERLDYLQMLNKNENPTAESKWYGINWARNTIADLPSAQKRGEWIPCSERLPEYNVSVLTWDGYAFCIEKRIPYIRDEDGFQIEGDYWVGDEYYDLESDYYPNLRDGAAIAWMPLPEPYKKGEANDDDK